MPQPNQPKQSPQPAITKSIVIRGAIVLVFCIAAFAAIVYRLVDLQLIDAAKYSELAAAQQLKDETITPNRGTIYDSEMKILAQSSTVWTVEVSPRDMKKYETDIYTLSMKMAEILELDQVSVYEKLQKSDTNYQLIKRQIDKATADTLRAYIKDYNADEKNKETPIVGVVFRQDSKRYYPYGSLASTVIGFTNVDGDGLCGLELTYNEQLKGVEGRVLAAKNAYGYDMAGQTYEARYEPVQGSGLVLTINENIQQSLEKYLLAAVLEHNVTERGVGIAMNPKTGAILAMASMPDYDLNQPFVIADPKKLEAIEAIEDEEQRKKARSDELWAQRRNKAVQDIYEPGSVFKIITAAAAIDSGTSNLNTAHTCSGSQLIVKGTSMRCAQTSGHGTLTFAAGLDNSCNPYFINLGQRMGKTVFSSYLQGFGFMDKTGIDMEDEGRNIVYSEENMGPVQLASSSFGQSSTITPISMISAISTAVNGGYVVQPHVVSKVVDAQGNVVKTTEPQIKRQIISTETSRIISDILEKSVNDGGHGKNAYVAGYRVGGKSGTSQKLSKQQQTGDDTLRIASFVGYAPANDPEIVVLVFLDEPHSPTNSSYGGRLVAPIVSNVIREAMPYLGVEPQYTEEELKYVDISAPNAVGMSIEDAKNQLATLGFNAKIEGLGGTITYQYPAPNTSLPRTSTILLYTEDNATGTKVVVPDVKELTIKDAKQAMVNAGLNVKTTGAVGNSLKIVAATQNIPAGAEVEIGTLITVNFHDITVVAEN